MASCVDTDPDHSGYHSAHEQSGHMAGQRLCVVPATLAYVKTDLVIATAECSICYIRNQHQVPFTLHCLR